MCTLQNKNTMKTYTNGQRMVLILVNISEKLYKEKYI